MTAKPNTESDKSIDEIDATIDFILYKLRPKDYLIDGVNDETRPERDAKVKQAKDQLFALLMDVIGEDEEVTTQIGKGSISRGTVVFTNRLRQEQRQKLKELFGKE